VQQQAGIAPPGTGRAVFAIADEAADLGAVTSINVTVDSASAQSTTVGWVAVSSTPKTYDLVQLKASGKQVLLADVQLQPGTYNQVRLMISKVLVTNSTGTYEAKLPSGELKIVGSFDVKANSTSAVSFDFEASESLHVTDNGKYLFAPVVRLSAKEDAEVEVKEKKDQEDDEEEAEVEIRGGRAKVDVKVGMDEDGEVGEGRGIAANVDVSIDEGTGAITIAVSGRADVAKNITAGKGRIVIAIGDKAANMSAVTSINVTVDNVSVHSAAQGWVTVSSAQKTYDLMQLQGKQALAADANLSAGTYQQIRLQISKVVVTDSNGRHEAKLPSGDLKIVSRITVNANETSTALVDVLANESLHLTANGTYLLAPVIRFETREDAEVEVKTRGEGEAEDEVEIRGGRDKIEIRVGMDENGETGEGREIDVDSEVSIESTGAQGGIRITIGIGAKAAAKEFSIDADDAGFYLDGQRSVSTISAAKGAAVEINFKVRSTGVYYAGLDFRGCGAEAKALPGKSVQLQFTAQETCTITSYWPTTGVVKASLQVVVS
jgi:hypothetical protein